MMEDFLRERLAQQLEIDSSLLTNDIINQVEKILGDDPQVFLEKLGGILNFGKPKHFLSNLKSAVSYDEDDKITGINLIKGGYVVFESGDKIKGMEEETMLLNLQEIISTFPSIVDAAKSIKAGTFEDEFNQVGVREITIETDGSTSQTFTSPNEYQA